MRISLAGNKTFKNEKIIVAVENPHIQSLASYILLKKFYSTCDKTKTRGKGEWRIYLTFRNKYMRRQKKLHGTLKCYICGKTDLNPNVNSPHAKDKEATLEHIYPISRGGKKYDEANLGIACSSCNQEKADKVININKAG